MEGGVGGGLDGVEGEVGFAFAGVAVGDAGAVVGHLGVEGFDFGLAGGFALGFAAGGGGGGCLSGFFAVLFGYAAYHLGVLGFEFADAGFVEAFLNEFAFDAYYGVDDILGEGAAHLGGGVAADHGVLVGAEDEGFAAAVGAEVRYGPFDGYLFVDVVVGVGEQGVNGHGEVLVVGGFLRCFIGAGGESNGYEGHEEEFLDHKDI